MRLPVIWWEFGWKSLLSKQQTAAAVQLGMATAATSWCDDPRTSHMASSCNAIVLLGNISGARCCEQKLRGWSAYLNDSYPPGCCAKQIWATVGSALSSSCSYSKVLDQYLILSEEHSQDVYDTRSRQKFILAWWCTRRSYSSVDCSATTQE